MYPEGYTLVGHLLVLQISFRYPLCNPIYVVNKLSTGYFRFAIIEAKLRCFDVFDNFAPLLKPTHCTYIA